MPWNADGAMREMWSGLDKTAANGEVMAYFRQHLQAAYEAGLAAAGWDETRLGDVERATQAEATLRAIALNLQGTHQGMLTREQAIWKLEVIAALVREREASHRTYDRTMDAGRKVAERYQNTLSKLAKE